jgi:cell division protein YceG involved in septum cleavage
MPLPTKTYTFIPRPRPPKKSNRVKRALIFSTPFLAIALVFTVGFFTLPSLLAADLQLADSSSASTLTIDQAFPVTVDPTSKTITTDPRVEALLDSRPSGLSASAGLLSRIFDYVAIKISELSAYQLVAGAGGFKSLFVTVHPGYRMEQVASAFGATLDWTPTEQQKFITASKKEEPTLPNGAVVPGIYFLNVTEPTQVANLVHARFEKDVAGRYGTTTQEQVPIEDAITIASMLERESGSWEDMRLISGVIWNRLFVGMRLQIDATLQYAEATGTKGKGGWWPSVEPKDKYIASAYNTYQHAGLPPAPIANPSIAAILAALNPKKTDCLFYFHDSHGVFHCTKTYAEHVKLLKQYYGQGK